MAPKATPSKDSRPTKQGFEPLAFEPKAKAKAKTKAETPKTAPKKTTSSKGKSQPKGQSKSTSAQGIPEVVSRRMAQRMALFCGIPTLLGLATFPTSYFMVRQGIELPNVAVLLVSMGLFGLGVVGLSYGALSASWDEDQSGSSFGWQEFKLNFGRTVEGWKAGRDRS